MSKDKYLRIKWRLSCRYPPNIFRNTGSFENRAQANIQFHYVCVNNTDTRHRLSILKKVQL